MSSDYLHATFAGACALAACMAGLATDAVSSSRWLVLVTVAVTTSALIEALQSGRTLVPAECTQEGR